MDINNIIGTTASLTSIILFGIEVYKITSNNKKSNTPSNVNDSSKATIDINLNKNDTTINSNNSTYVNKKIINNTVITKISPNTFSSSSDSNDFGLFVIIFILIGSVVSKFYLNNRSLIIFWLIMLGILSFTITITCSLILAKNRLITNLSLYMQTIKWFPLFTGIIFIYNPFYNSDSLNTVAELIKNGTGIVNILFKYSNDFLFFLLQLLGLALIALTFIGYLIYTIKTTYIALKKDIPVLDISKKDIIFYFIMLFFIFIFVSGLYVEFFKFISTST